MGKSTRMPVLAAGGIVIRQGRTPLIAIVQRSRDDAWVLPKGKLKPNERPIAGARREAMEETGCAVRVHEFLGVISYVGGSGPKIAHFWRMQAVGQPTDPPANDVKAVEWLSLPAAIDRLTLSHERFFLRHIGRHALRRSLKRARIRPPVRVSVPPFTDAAAPDNAADGAKPHTGPKLRWPVIARLTKRWQAAVGLTGNRSPHRAQ